jgi:hypothetical protein
MRLPSRATFPRRVVRLTRAVTSCASRRSDRQPGMEKRPRASRRTRRREDAAKASIGVPPLVGARGLRPLRAAGPHPSLCSRPSASARRRAGQASCLAVSGCRGCRGLFECALRAAEATVALAFREIVCRPSLAPA